MESSRSKARWSPSRLLESVRRHVARHIGPVDVALCETGRSTLPISLLHVPPSERRPFHVLVTSGMGARPMNVPPGDEPRARAELFLLLAREWPCSRRAWSDPRWGWPARELRRAARAPHETSSWLGCGNILRNGATLRPYAPGTRLCAALLAHPVSIAEEFATLRRPEGRVRFYQFIPLYREELLFASRHSSNALFARFAQLQIDDVITSKRCNVGRLPDPRGGPASTRAEHRRQDAHAILLPFTSSVEEGRCSRSIPCAPSPCSVAPCKSQGPRRLAPWAPSRSPADPSTSSPMPLREAGPTRPPALC